MNELIDVLTKDLAEGDRTRLLAEIAPELGMDPLAFSRRTAVEVG